jgi:hypothetical protein
VERIIKRVITREEVQKRALVRSARKGEGRRWKKGRKGEVGAECPHLTIGNRRLTIAN